MTRGNHWNCSRSCSAVNHRAHHKKLYHGMVTLKIAFIKVCTFSCFHLSFISFSCRCRWTFETNLNFALKFWCTTHWPFVCACVIFSSSHMSLSNRFLYKGRCCSVFHLYNLVDNIKISVVDPNLWPIKFKLNPEYDDFPSCEQINTLLFMKYEVISFQRIIA